MVEFQLSQGVVLMKVFGLLILAAVCLVSYLIGSGTNGAAMVATVIFFPAMIALYFYPSICAYNEHPKATPIFALNLLAGWTFIGWIAAFVWSLNVPPPPSTAGTNFYDRAEQPVANDPTKVCPHCAETIKAAAKKCRYCGSDLDEQLA